MIPGRRIPIPNSLVGQDMWFSPTRPGFESRLGKRVLFFFFLQVADTWSMLTTCGSHMSRLAQLVERKTLNLVVVGSSPTVGDQLLWRSWQRVGLIILRSRVRSSPGAVVFLF